MHAANLVALEAFLNVDRGKSLFKREFAANIVAQLRNDVRLFDTYDREQAPQPLLMFQ